MLEFLRNGPLRNWSRFCSLRRTLHWLWPRQPLPLRALKRSKHCLVMDHMKIPFRCTKLCCQTCSTKHWLFRFVCYRGSRHDTCQVQGQWRRAWGFTAIDFLGNWSLIWVRMQKVIVEGQIFEMENFLLWQQAPHIFGSMTVDLNIFEYIYLSHFFHES